MVAAVPRKLATAKCLSKLPAPTKTNSIGLESATCYKCATSKCHLPVCIKMEWNAHRLHADTHEVYGFRNRTKQLNAICHVVFCVCLFASFIHSFSSKYQHFSLRWLIFLCPTMRFFRVYSVFNCDDVEH